MLIMNRHIFTMILHLVRIIKFFLSCRTLYYLNLFFKESITDSCKEIKNILEFLFNTDKILCSNLNILFFWGQNTIDL